MHDRVGGGLCLAHSVNSGLRKADPLRIVSVLFVADVDVLDLDVALGTLTSLLPLGICASILTSEERVSELDWCVPRLLLLELNIQAWEI